MCERWWLSKRRGGGGAGGGRAGGRGAGGGGAGGGGAGGIQNQKQEPHTKMWGKNNDAEDADAAKFAAGGDMPTVFPGGTEPQPNCLWTSQLGGREGSYIYILYIYIYKYED